VKFCVPDSRKREGQLYLRFAAVCKCLTVTAVTSACPTDTRPGRLPATGLFSLALGAEKFRQMFVCMRETGIQYTERAAVDYACNYIYVYIRLFSNTSCAISVRR
jgi:hypothetical protein